jgi:hypothetical protein
MNSLRTAVALLAAAAVALGLAACAAPQPAQTVVPTPATTVRPSAAPTPTVTKALAPEPLLNLTCPAVISTATLSSSLPAPVTPVDPAQTAVRAYPVIPEIYALRSLGGLACEWSNGLPLSDRTGQNPGYIGVQVLVLPNASSQWEKFVAMYGSSGAVGAYCANTMRPLYCSTNRLTGTNWVEVTVYGANSEAAGTALGAEAVAAVAASTSGGAAWTPPLGTRALPSTCPGVIPDATVKSALGISVPVQASSGAGGWSLKAGAIMNWGGPHCYWALSDSDSGVGSLATVPGGAWAWAEARSFLTSPEAPTAVTVTGLASGDEAWLRCAPSDAYCLIDLIVGGNWVQAHVWQDAGSPVIDRRAGALAIGTAIVATLSR